MEIFKININNILSKEHDLEHDKVSSKYMKKYKSLIKVYHLTISLIKISNNI